MALILSLLSGMRHREAAEALTGESPFLGLQKEPECANPQHSNTAVLDWHPGMLSGWCQHPPFPPHNLLFSLLGGQGNFKK